MGAKDWFKDKWSEVKKKCEKKDERSELERQIEAAAEVLRYHDPDSDEYKAIVESIEKLALAQAEMDEAKAKLHPKAAWPKPDVNTVLAIGGGIAATVVGVVVTAYFESEHGGDVLFRSKGWNFIPKPPNKM